MAGDRLSHAEQPEEMSRGAFIAAILAGLAALVGFGAATLRLYFPNATLEPPLTFKAGKLDTYEPGSVTTDAVHKVFIVREPEGVYVVEAVCTHLGCMARWQSQEEIFFCPCHGSKFHKDGVNFFGPAPSPLRRVKVSLADDGRLLVEKGVTIEQSDWDNELLRV